jgi:hypothetical protein
VKSVYASRLILFVFGICRYLFQPDVAELEEEERGRRKERGKGKMSEFKSYRGRRNKPLPISCRMLGACLASERH